MYFNNSLLSQQFICANGVPAGSREKPREIERNREEDSVLNGCQVPAYVVKFQEKLKQYNQSIWALNRAQSLVARSSIKFLPKK